MLQAECHRPEEPVAPDVHVAFTTVWGGFRILPQTGRAAPDGAFLDGLGMNAIAAELMLPVAQVARRPTPQLLDISRAEICQTGQGIGLAVNHLGEWQPHVGTEARSIHAVHRGDRE